MQPEQKRRELLAPADHRARINRPANPEGGNTSSYAYDDAGRRTSMTDADNKVWNYEYDAAGNKTAEVDQDDLPGPDVHFDDV